MKIKRPDERFKIGAFEVSIWENSYEGKPSYTFTLQKSYKKDDEWIKQRICFFDKQINQCIEALENSRKWINNKKK